MCVCVGSLARRRRVGAIWGVAPSPRRSAGVLFPLQVLEVAADRAHVADLVVEVAVLVLVAAIEDEFRAVPLLAVLGGCWLCGCSWWLLVVWLFVLAVAVGWDSGLRHLALHQTSGAHVVLTLT